MRLGTLRILKGLSPFRKHIDLLANHAEIIVVGFYEKHSHGVTLFICFLFHICIIYHNESTNLYYNSPQVCLLAFANCRSQFLHDRLGRCLQLSVSSRGTSCHEFASQFGLAIFFYAKTFKTLANTASPTRVVN